MASFRRPPGAILRALGMQRYRCMSCLRSFLAWTAPERHELTPGAGANG
jgi:hypothetical protein